MVNKGLCDRHAGRTPSPSSGAPCSDSAHFHTEDRRCVVSPSPERSRFDLLRHVGKLSIRRSRLSDCPTGASFGVLYAGEDPHCCFIESCGATTGVPAVSGAYLDAREIARLELAEELRFIDLATSGGLTHVGADARLVTGSYKVAQRWSAALRLHPSKPDGIRYPARHDPTRVAYAIFTRPHTTFKVTSLGSLTASSNRALLNQLLHDYNVDLI